jgi:hypothetical protein
MPHTARYCPFDEQASPLLAIGMFDLNMEGMNDMDPIVIPDTVPMFAVPLIASAVPETCPLLRVTPPIVLGTAPLVTMR